MGSWDACCGISKMPIRVGDEVMDFLIADVRAARGSGFICYPSDLWAPLTIQITGKYDDYGRIVPTTPKWHEDFVLSRLREALVEVEQGPNEMHDIAVTRDALDYDLVQEAVHEGRLRVFSSRKGLALPVSRMMVHRFVFEEVVSWGLDTWTRGRVGLDDLVSDGVEGLRRLRRRLDGMPEELRELTLSGIDLSETRDNLLLGSFGYMRGDGSRYLPHGFNSYLRLLVERHDDPALEEIVREIARYVVFSARMGEMQFLWTPQTGSQHHAYEALSRLYRRCTDHADEHLGEDDGGGTGGGPTDGGAPPSPWRKPEDDPPPCGVEILVWARGYDVDPECPYQRLVAVREAGNLYYAVNGSRLLEVRLWTDLPAEPTADAPEEGRRDRR